MSLNKILKEQGLPLFQASAAMLMVSALFWDIMRRRVLIVYRRFGTCRSRLHGSRVRVGKPVKMGPTRCPETSVNNYDMTSRNIPEDRRSQQGLRPLQVLLNSVLKLALLLLWLYR